ncbi:Glycosyl phosphatidyl inositol anchor synthesis [Xanthoria parietina]
MMARLGRFGFLGVAIVFHLIYIRSIFDIYFVSPIVSGMRPYAIERSSSSSAPAQRLVLFVGDGLRADKAFQSFPDPSPPDPDAPGAREPRPLAPFLRSRVLEHGTFGVSHTRVPTESRPGHVALIAGLYEDVSSVTTGWKLNPVNFDSVFNRSRHTWSWGSPDILPMFKEGASPGRIDAETYGEEFEDYSKDGTELDTWVFDKVRYLFACASTNGTLDAALRRDKNVFFLHLLGLDMTGHAYRPYSKEYLHNIKVVDQGVQEISRLIDDFYGDRRTAYVFTADHGMSDWGSHGDGHPDNTRTPLIAWGSGVAKPVISSSGTALGHEDGFSADWGLDSVRRHDVNQADIAALMAYLAGLELPVNSVGQLPLSYLTASVPEQAEAMLVNAREVLEMYRVKEQDKKAKEIRYRPYAKLGNGARSAEQRVLDIRQAIDQGQYEQGITMSQDLLQIGLEGMRYLQTYDWLFLRMLVTIGYLGWIAFALTTVIDLHVLQNEGEFLRSTVTSAFCGIVLIGLLLLLWLRSAPYTYYLYASFPVIFWEEVLQRRSALASGVRLLLAHSPTSEQDGNLLLKGFAFVGLLEALVLSYFHRSVYTICFVAAAFWPLVYGRDFISRNKILIATWSLACLSMSGFTLLPVIKIENISVILLGGLLMASVGLLYLLFEKSILSTASPTRGQLSSPLADGLSRNILGAQIGLIMLAMVITKSSVASLQAKRGLPLGNQIIGWLVLIASLTLPFLHSLQPNSHYLHRLVILFLTFSPIFIILTISYEGLFYFVFCATLVTWVRLEHHIYTYTRENRASPPPSPIPAPKPLKSAMSDISTQLRSSNETSDLEPPPLPPTSDPTATEATPPDVKPSPCSPYRPLTLSDARISLFFLYLLQSAFFSTGNIASISSFSLDSVYRLIPVFNPFSQGALLLLKLLIPFALISANLGILNQRLGVAPSSLFMVVMAISDVLTLNFFWMVRDEGSWLDIGTSISHFCIASMLCVFVAGLEFLSEVFVSGVEVAGEEEVGGKGNGNGVVKGEPSREKAVGEEQGNGSVGLGKAVAKDVKLGSS